MFRPSCRACLGRHGKWDQDNGCTFHACKGSEGDRGFQVPVSFARVPSRSSYEISANFFCNEANPPAPSHDVAVLPLHFKLLASSTSSFLEMRETARFPQVVKKQSSPRGCNVSQKNQPLAWHWLLQTVGLITNCLTISGTSKFWNQIVTSLKELSLGHVLKNWSPGHIQAAETAGKFYCLSKNQIRQCWESKRGQGHAE